MHLPAFTPALPRGNTPREFMLYLAVGMLALGTIISTLWLNRRKPEDSPAQSITPVIKTLPKPALPLEPLVKEPTYKGRTPKDWLKLLKYGTIGEQSEALGALEYFPVQYAESIPLLVECAEKQPRFCTLVFKQLARYGTKAQPAQALALAHLGDERVISDPACEVLGNLGSNAKEALPALEKLLRDDRRVAAAQALCKIDPARGVEAVSALLILSKSTNHEVEGLIEAVGCAGLPGVLRLAVWLEAPPVPFLNRPELPMLLGLIRAGATAKPAASLVAKCTEKEYGVGGAAWYALQLCAPEMVNADKAIDTWITQIGRVNVNDPCLAGLKFYKARSAQEILKRVGKGRKAEDVSLLHTLGLLGPDAQCALDFLREEVKTDAHQLREQALRILGVVGMPVEEVLPIIREYLNTPELQQAVLYSADKLGAGAEPLLSDIKKAIPKMSAENADYAKYVLEQVEWKVKIAATAVKATPKNEEF